MTHDSRPQLLTARVRPSDIPQYAAANYGSRFVLYSDRQQRLCTLGPHEGLAVSLARGESDLITVVPILEVKGLSVAAIGELPLLFIVIYVQEAVIQGSFAPGALYLLRNYCPKHLIWKCWLQA